MNKVFVVTDGDYSDYHIIGVFSSMEKAAEFCPAAASGVGSCDIEEYTLDTIDNDEYLQNTFCVWIDAATGNRSSPYYSSAELHPRDYTEVVLVNGFPGYSGRPDTPDRIAATSVVSAEHALKLAAEYRQALLRQKA